MKKYDKNYLTQIFTFILHIFYFEIILFVWTKLGVDTQYSPTLSRSQPHSQPNFSPFSKLENQLYGRRWLRFLWSSIL